LVDHSHGIPRQLNLLCNNALIRAYRSDLRFVAVKFAREAIREYENLAGTGEEFREPVARRALHSMASHSAIPIAGVSLFALIGLYSLMVTMPERQPFIPKVANTEVTPSPETDVIDNGRKAAPIINAADSSVVDPALGGSSANGKITLSPSHAANSEAAKRAPRDANAIQPSALAQASGASSVAPASISTATAAGDAAAFKSQKTSLLASISRTIIEGHGESGPSAAPAHHLRRHKAPRKPRKWVIQSKVQLALQSDPRLKERSCNADATGRDGA
jgi:hypothetical protein